MNTSAMDSTTTIDVIKARAARLGVSKTALENATELLLEAGWRDKDAADRLRREWLNDVIVDPSEEAYAKAASDPDESFLVWVGQRAKDPFHVSYRAVDRVGRQMGSDVAVLMISMRWPQEIAWAQRCRRHENPEVAVKAALFLAEARRDPSKVFQALTEVYQRTIAEDRGYALHSNHEISAEEIRSGIGVTDGWFPLFMRYAGSHFSRILDSLSEDKLLNLARTARRDEEEEQRRVQLESCLAYLARWPLSCRISALHLALRDRMQANDLVACEEAFIEALRRGDVVLPDEGKAVDTLFFEWMRGGDYKPDRADKKERERRRQQLHFLDRSWLESLPADVIELGAASRSVFHEWRTAVLSGQRVPPRSVPVDYAMFVLERVAP